MDDFYSRGVVGAVSNGLTGIPVTPIDADENKVKLSHDSYEVFINGDKVGNKILLTQVDGAQDLEFYLRENGFQDFDYEIVGGYIEIRAKEDSHQMKEILSSYLSIK